MATNTCIVILYFQNCKQLEAGETTPLLKTADMNQNESAKGDRGKGLPSVKTIKLVTNYRQLPLLIPCPANKLFKFVGN